MEEINVSNTKTILLKLPYKFRDRSGGIGHVSYGSHGHQDRFSDRPNRETVNILSDPLFGDIQDVTTVKDSIFAKAKGKSKPTGRSFATIQ